MKVDGIEDRYPKEPSPCKLENKEAEEIKLDGTEDRYPREPSPCKLENKEAEEIKLDGTEERKPIDPKPTKELVSCGVEIILDKLFIADDKYPSVPRPLIVLCSCVEEI